MKRIINTLVCILTALSFCISCSAQETVAENEITVRLNGAELRFPAQPVNKGGSVYVPMRVIFEAMGRNVTWDDSTKTVTASDAKGDYVQISIGSCNMLSSDGTVSELPSAPEIENGTTMIPLRGISEALGAQVVWNEESSCVGITYKTKADVTFKKGDYPVEWKGAAEKLDISVPCEITSSGIYEITGKSENASVTVNVDDKTDSDNIYIVLNGAELSSASSTPINVISGAKVVLILADGTENTVSGGADGESESEITAAIFSKSDLTITGGGSLVVTADYNDGITSRDKLKITGGNVSVTAVGDGLMGRDAFAAENAVINVNAGKDGIRTTNTADTSGDILLNGGTVQITAGGDGISAEGTVEINDGTISIEAGGGYSDDIKHTSDSFGGRGMKFDGQLPMDADGAPEDTERPIQPSGDNMMQRKMRPDRGRDGEENSEGDFTPPEKTPEEKFMLSSVPVGETGAPPEAPRGRERMQQNEISSAETADGEVSKKGIKSSCNVIINDGTISVSSYDDAIHSGCGIVISGGSVNIQSGDDAVHSDSYICIGGGSVNIEKSYEGLEAYFVTVESGSLSIISSDDGINANSSGGLLLINGGDVYINSCGDGLDSNGLLRICGGTTIIDGPENSGNSAIDAETGIVQDGGILIAAGSSGMAQQPGSSSAQASFMISYYTPQAAGPAVEVRNSNGEAILTAQPSVSFGSIVFSCPEYRVGEEYTVITGGAETVTFTPDRVNIYVTKDGVSQVRGGIRGFGRERPGEEINNRSGGAE